MMENKTTEQELKEENADLKKALAICINKPLIKQINGALDRINRGEYVSESEFISSSPIMTQ